MEEVTIEHIVIDCEESKGIMEKLIEGDNPRYWTILYESSNITAVEAFKNFKKMADKIVQI